MAVNVSVSEELMQSALEVADGQSEGSVVESALRLWIQIKSQAAAKDLLGKYEWTGNLEESQLGQHAD